MIRSLRAFYTISYPAFFLMARLIPIYETSVIKMYSILAVFMSIMVI